MILRRILKIILRRILRKFTCNRGSLHSRPMLCWVSNIPSTLNQTLINYQLWGWWPPHWWREPSWCQRWQRFSHHLQPPEVAVVCPIKRQDVALLFLLVSCKDSPSSTALDWHEQSDKKFRRFGRRNQLSDRTCPQIISAFGKHYWNWSFTAVTICDFDVRNKPYCRVHFASPSFHVNTETRSASELVLCTTCSFIVVINVIVLDC